MTIPILCPMSLTSFYDPYDGSVLAASLYYYKAGTEDPLTVYSDPSTQRIWAQPILTGGSGRVPPVWVDQIDVASDKNRYRVRSFDQYGVLLEDIDNLPGGLADPVDAEVVPPTSGTLPPIPSPLDEAIFHTGDIMMAWNIAPAGKAGWLRCNGGTIGKGSGSEGSGSTIQALYLHLWNNDPDFLLHAQGGTAQAAYDSGAEITLPDFRSRVPVGMDPMGDGSQTFPFRMEGATLSTTKGGALGHLGANGGVASHTIIIDELPKDFSPKVKEGTDGLGHSHVLTNPAHNHPLPQYPHTHTVVSTDTNDNPVGQPGNAQGTANRIFTATTGGAYADIAIEAVAQNTTMAKALTGITIEPFGKGTPFSMVQPFVTVAFYIHL